MTTKKYLDENGLAYLWQKVKANNPNVYNGVLAIQKNGANVQTFSANQSGNVTANITVPTNNNELTNGAGYQTANDVQTAITTAISGIVGVKFEVVASLPTTGDAGTIYLISNSGTAPNVYDEYIYVNNGWEKIGTTDVDLSGYVQDSDLVAITNNEIDTIVAS